MVVVSTVKQHLEPLDPDFLVIFHHKQFQP